MTAVSLHIVKAMHDTYSVAEVQKGGRWSAWTSVLSFYLTAAFLERTRVSESDDWG